MKHPTGTRKFYPTWSLIFSVPNDGDKDAEIQRLKGEVTRLEADLNTTRRKSQEMQDDNADFREKNRKLRAQVSELEAKLPTDGSVVLTKEEAETWNAFKELNLKPDEVKKKIADHDKLAKAEADRAKEESVRKAAEAHGYKPEVLSELAKARGLEFEIGEIEVQKADGTGNEKKPVAYVKNAQGVKERLNEFVDRDLKDFLPSLSAAKAEGDEGGSHGGTPWINSGSGGGAASDNNVDDYLKKRNEARAAETNPLSPKPAAKTA